MKVGGCVEAEDAALALRLSQDDADRSCFAPNNSLPPTQDGGGLNPTPDTAVDADVGVVVVADCEERQISILTIGG